MESKRREGGQQRRKRVEELTRITKTPKRQRAPPSGLRRGVRRRREPRHEGGEKVYLLTTSGRDRESAVFFVLGEKRTDGRSRDRNSRESDTSEEPSFSFFFDVCTFITSDVQRDAISRSLK